MKKLRIILCICFAVAMLLCMCAAANAANGGCGDKGENVLWSVDDEGTLTISGEGAIKDSASCPWAFFKVSRVVIEEGVTRVGKRAFYQMKDVKEVVLPESLEVIGYEAFYGCTGLKEITIPTGVKEIEEYAFVNCTNLFKVNTEDLAAWCDIYFKSAFANPLFPARHLYLNDEKVIKLEIPEGVTAIGDFAFYTSPEFCSVKLPEGLESIGRFAFYECAGVKEVTLPDSLRYVGQSAFEKCARLNELTVGPIIGAMTAKEMSFPTDSLKMVTVSEGTQAIGPEAFKEYRKLESVVLPESLKAIGKDAFYSCTALRNVVITDLAPWCEISFACPYSNPLFFAENLWIKDGDLLTKVVCPEIPDGVTAIGDFAFYNYKSLRKITLPDSATDIGHYAFFGCKELKEAVLSPNIDSVGQYAFKGCDKLVDVTLGDILSIHTLQQLSIPAEQIRMVTVLRDTSALVPGAFKNCAKLESVVLPASLMTFGKDAFFGCARLRNVVIEDLKSWCMADFANPFANPLILSDHLYEREEDGTLHEITALYIPEDITYVKPFAFYGCKGLMTVEIPEGVTDIAPMAFYNCKNLVAAVMPKSLRSIGQEAFRYCDKLTRLRLPGDLLVIAQDSFKNCTNISYLTIGKIIQNGTLKQLWIPTAALKEVTVSEGVGFIPDNAFRDCAKLEEIILPESLTFIGKDSFFGCTALKKTDAATMRSWLSIDFICPYSNPVIYSHRLFIRGREVLALTVPKGITEVKDYAFYGAWNINVLNISSDVKRIGVHAFCGCTALKKAGLPEGVEIIDDYAFRNCQNMTDLVLPKSLTYVGQGAFDGCGKLKNIWYAGTDEQWKEIGGPGRNITLNKNAKVYYNSVATSDDITPVLSGDADGDGIITAADARVALRAAVLLDEYAYDDPVLIACDWDCDGRVTPSDARMILRYSVGLH